MNDNWEEKMKFTRRDAAKLLTLPVLFYTTKATIGTANAANTNSPEFREAVQSAMLEYIDATKINGKHLIFDAVKGDYVSARFVKLHTNLALVADTFYVSCADFVDDDGNTVDLDYMVAEQDGYWAVFQSVVHMRDGTLRQSHMENAKVIFAKCGASCGASCGSKCRTKCGASCGTKCGATCGSKCGAACGSKCGASCGAKCGASCGTKCGASCGTKCGASCGASCGTKCGASCGSKCGASCGTKCGTSS